MPAYLRRVVLRRGALTVFGSSPVPSDDGSISTLCIGSLGKFPSVNPPMKSSRAKKDSDRVSSVDKKVR